MCVDRLQCRELLIKHGPDTSFEGRRASSGRYLMPGVAPRDTVHRAAAETIRR